MSLFFRGKGKFVPSSARSNFRRSCARSLRSRSGSLVAFPAHPPRLKAAPFMQQQHGYGKRKKTIDGDGEKMKMEKRKKREEDARSMNQLDGMSNKILISLVNYLPVISLRIVPSFSFSFPISSFYSFSSSVRLCRKKYSLANNTNIREFRNL